MALIGTGLFVAGGEVVSTAGPGGALVAYGLIGIMVYFLMTSLGKWRRTCRFQVPLGPMQNAM